MNAQTVEVLESQKQISRILEESGKHFRAGLEDLKANRRQDAAEDFNRSVETFLLSTLNIQRDAKLQACYSQLVETIYRMEYPVNNQPPQLRPLSGTCGWNWTKAENKLADDVIALLEPAKPMANGDAATIASIAPRDSQTAHELSGFNNQVFEALRDDGYKTWQGISDRTGVSVDALMAANPGMSTPIGKVFVPMWLAANVKVVKAQAGDTISKLAERNNADPLAVAKFNGLLPTSILSAGREIRIPHSSDLKETRVMNRTSAARGDANDKNQAATLAKCDPNKIHFRGLKLGDTTLVIERAVVPSNRELRWFLLIPTSGKFKDVEEH